MNQNFLSDVDSIFGNKKSVKLTLENIEPGSETDQLLRTLSQNLQSKYGAGKRAADLIALHGIQASDSNITSISELSHYIAGLQQAQDEMKAKFQEIVTGAGIQNGSVREPDLMPKIIAMIESGGQDIAVDIDSSGFSFLDSL